MFNRGELNGKPVWWAATYNEGKYELIPIVGKKPEGARRVTGAGAAIKSLVKVGKGKLPPADLFKDTGAVDMNLTISDGKPKLTFTKDIAISDRRGSISGSRTPRISPKMRRLR